MKSKTAGVVVPVILCGGIGSRLWPLSRENYPKQFLRLSNGPHSLLQETILRVRDFSHMAKPLIICNEKHYFMCLDQLNEIKHKDSTILLEPVRRNTAGAIAIAAHYVKAQYGEQAVMLIFPADHFIKEDGLFSTTIQRTIEVAEQHKMVTIGIQPSSPNTSYGYIKAGAAIDEHSFEVERFVEKPSQEKAVQYCQEGHYYWNSGMFSFTAQTYLAELKQYAHDIFVASTHAFALRQGSDAYIRLDEVSFAKCRNESIDYAVMEHSHNIAMVPFGGVWTDLGCWNALADIGEKDDNNNVLQGDVLAKDSKNCFIKTNSHVVATLGIQDQIIVSTDDAVLVADKKYTQDVKALLEQLKTMHPQAAATHKMVYRPWGYYYSLIKGQSFHVKHIVVNAQARLSLQMHQHRAEHWVIVSGIADVICGDQQFTLEANQSAYISCRTKHRLSNAQDTPLHVIEVQTGDYLGEDDIIRFEDMYHREIEDANS